MGFPGTEVTRGGRVMDSLAGLYLVLANTSLNCFREQAWTDRRSCFLWHSEEPVSCDRGSYPLQEVLSPSLGHSDSAASSWSPNNSWYVVKELVGRALTAELLPQRAERRASGGHSKDRCSLGRDPTLLLSLTAQHSV